MRLWSIHPKYLDTKGLVALWRESLLARAVLQGQTKGYTRHPQLIRFQNHPKPLLAINTYLLSVLEESKHRGYKFDENKVDKGRTDIQIDVKTGQIEYEYHFLCEKLKKRDLLAWNNIKETKIIETHPLFVTTEGGIELWEKIK